jgi:hypothetical protein
MTPATALHRRSGLGRLFARASASRASERFGRFFVRVSSATDADARTTTREDEEGDDDARGDGGKTATTTTRAATTRERMPTTHASRFAVDEREAREAMRAWLAASTRRPRAVRGVGGNGEPRYRPAYAPYWVFDVDAETTYRGSVQVEGNWIRAGATPTVRTFDATRSESQVCANFTHRRDYVDSLRPGESVDFSDASMLWEEVRREAPANVKIEPFEMRRSMALSLATARMRDATRSEAKKELLEKYKNATATRDVVVEFTTLGRVVRAVYHPVWYVSFSHGSIVDAETSKIIQQPREAVVCGVTGKVLSDELYCETKARAVAFSAVALPAAVAAMAWPDSALLWLGQGGVGAVAAAASAAVVARSMPKMEQAKVDAERVCEEERAFERAMRSSGNVEWMDESVQRYRDDAEWIRWAELDKLNWDRRQRQAWAYNILETQIYRCRERQEMRQEMEERAQQADEAERRQAAKEKRWGAEFKRESTRAPSGRHPGHSRDIHGFYKVLRLSERLGLATEEEVKAAYRAVALETHPDKVVGDEAAKKRAAERFQLVQKAYATLGDKEARVAYDRK